MIALLAAAAVALNPTAPPALSSDVVLAKYQAALATHKDPRVFAVEYSLEQTGPRTLEQVHRVFRSGGDERDETIVFNGAHSSTPVVRIFRARPYRYAVGRLAPKPTTYDFTYLGTHRVGKHVDYVFRLTPKAPSHTFALTDVTIDGVTYLPSSVAFVTGQHGGRGSVTFAKADRWWVASGATASARLPGGVAHERLTFSRWRFPPSLPRSTFAAPRPLPTPKAAALP